MRTSFTHLSARPDGGHRGRGCGGDRRLGLRLVVGQLGNGLRRIGGARAAARSSSSATRLRRPSTTTPSSPAFQKTSAGNGTSVNQSYGASGDQARAVAAGLHADLVALLARPGRSTCWSAKGLVNRRTGRRTPHTTGIVSDSVVVLGGPRRGTRRRSRGWGDLIEPGVQVITPNPLRPRAVRQLERDGRLRRSAQGRQDG